MCASHEPGSIPGACDFSMSGSCLRWAAQQRSSFRFGTAYSPIGRAPRHFRRLLRPKRRLARISLSPLPAVTSPYCASHSLLRGPRRKPAGTAHGRCGAAAESLGWRTAGGGEGRRRWRQCLQQQSRRLPSHGSNQSHEQPTRQLDGGDQGGLGQVVCWYGAHPTACAAIVATRWR
jgi:hypothetical protein